MPRRKDDFTPYYLVEALRKDHPNTSTGWLIRRANIDSSAYYEARKNLEATGIKVYRNGAMNPILERLRNPRPLEERESVLTYRFVEESRKQDEHKHKSLTELCRMFGKDTNMYYAGRKMLMKAGKPVAGIIRGPYKKRNPEPSEMMRAATPIPREIINGSYEKLSVPAEVAAPPAPTPAPVLPAVATTIAPQVPKHATPPPNKLMMLIGTPEQIKEFMQ